MKRKLFVILVLIGCLILTGCSITCDNNDNLTFKEKYEELNNTTSEVSGKTFRSITIDEDNPFIYIDSDKLLKKIYNNDSFFIYIGSPYCPWCRSVIESMIKSAKQNGISKIYYLEAWNGDHVETLRDKYEIDDNGKLNKVSNGDKNYDNILKLFGDYLEEYTLTDKDGNEVKINEKRLYIPSLFYVKEGKAVAFTDGISANQESSTDELTEEILSDELKEFNEVFEKINTCDKKC